MSRRHRGFTMMELVVAIALAGLISAATTTAFVGLYGAQKRLEQQAAADQEAKALLDVILVRAQMAGGDQVRPWDAIVIDDDCRTPLVVGGVTVPACPAGADRLHILKIDPALPQARLASPGAVLGSTFNGRTAPCSLDGIPEGQSGILISTSGAFRPATCATLSTACACTDPGSAAGFRSAGAASANFDGGVFVIGAVQTYFLDGGVLKIVTDADADGTAEVTELADRVADFQVEYGFDSNADFVVDGYSGTLTSPRETMRMLRVGLILDVPTPSRTVPSTARVLSGPVHRRQRGSYLYATQSKALLRNLDLFF